MPTLAKYLYPAGILFFGLYVFYVSNRMLVVSFPVLVTYSPFYYMSGYTWPALAILAAFFLLGSICLSAAKPAYKPNWPIWVKGFALSVLLAGQALLLFGTQYSGCGMKRVAETNLLIDTCERGFSIGMLRIELDAFWLSFFIVWTISIVSVLCALLLEERKRDDQNKAA